MYYIVHLHVTILTGKVFVCVCVCVCVCVQVRDSQDNFDAMAVGGLRVE